MNDSNTMTIGDLCEFKYGSSLPAHRRRVGKIPVYGSNGIVGFHEDSLTSGPTIIIGRKGSIGEVHYSSVPCFPIDTTYFISETKIPCDLKWLTHVLRCLRLPDLNKSSAVPGLNRQDAYDKKIIVPPLHIQVRIAAILEKADAAREKRRQTIELTETFLQSAFLEMFGDPVTNPKGWKKTTLGDLAPGITDGKHGDCRNSPGSGYYFISAKDIIDGSINYTNARQIDKEDFEDVHRRTRLDLNDLLITNSGSIGKIAIAKDIDKIGNTIFQKSVAIVKPRRELVYPTFLKGILEMTKQALINSASGSSQKNLLISQLKSFSILLPPLFLQQKFATLVEKVEAMRTKQRASEQELENLFQSLMQRAFKGELV